MSSQTWLYSGFMYIPAFVVTAAHCVAIRCRHSELERRNMWRPIAFFTMIAVSFGLRTGWCFLRVVNNGFLEHTLNRLALLAFFAAFAIYVLGWAEMLDSEWMPKLNRIALVFNIVFSVAIVASSVVAELLSGEAGKLVYDTNIILIVVVQLVLSLLFVVLCAKLRRRLHIVFSQVQSTVALHASRKIAVATWVCVVCFLLRAFFWLYEPVTGDYPGTADTDKYFYPWWYYQVPELVPSFTMMMLIAPRSVKQDGQLETRRLGLMCCCPHSRGRDEERSPRASSRSNHAGHTVLRDDDGGRCDVTNPIFAVEHSGKFRAAKGGEGSQRSGIAITRSPSHDVRHLSNEVSSHRSSDESRV